MQRCSMHILCTSWCRSLRTSVDLHSFMVFGRVNVGDLQVPYVKWYFASSELSLALPPSACIRVPACPCPRGVMWYISCLYCGCQERLKWSYLVILMVSMSRPYVGDSLLTFLRLTILPDSLTSWESASSSFKTKSVAENNWTMIPSNVIS